MVLFSVYALLLPAKDVWGNVLFLHLFVCSLGSLYDVTSCLAAWCHVPSRGVSVWDSLCPGGLCLGVCVQGSLCPGVSVWGFLARGLCLGVSVQRSLSKGVSVWGSLSKGVSVRYASYRNAFLFLLVLRLIKIPRSPYLVRCKVTLAQATNETK